MTSSNPHVSVIVPVYNKERRLEACLESLLMQSLEDIEIICVNDASTDSCATILKEFAASDDRIRVIAHDTNQGVGAARNTGIEEARGEYISFVDADDTLTNDALQKVYDLASENDADIALFGIALSHPSQNIVEPSSVSLDMGKVNIADGPAFTADAAGSDAFLFASASAASKLFKTNFIRENGLRFTAHKIAEDLLFSLTAMALAERIVALEEFVYLYDQETSSNVVAPYTSIPEFLDVLNVLKRRLEDMGKYDLYKDAFMSMAMGHLENRFNSAQTAEALTSSFDSLKNADPDLFSDDTEEIVFSNDGYKALYELVQKGDALEYAASRIAQLETRALNAEKLYFAAKSQLDGIADSTNEPGSNSREAKGRLKNAPAKAKSILGRLGKR